MRRRPCAAELVEQSCDHGAADGVKVMTPRPFGLQERQTRSLATVAKVLQINHQLIMTWKGVDISSTAADSLVPTVADLAAGAATARHRKRPGSHETAERVSRVFAQHTAAAAAGGDEEEACATGRSKGRAREVGRPAVGTRHSRCYRLVRFAGGCGNTTGGWGCRGCHRWQLPQRTAAGCRGVARRQGHKLVLCRRRWCRGQHW